MKLPTRTPLVRKVLIVIAILIAIAVAWPIYVGVQVEQALRQPRTGNLGGVRIDHTITGYQREHYRARATSVLHVFGNDLDFEVHLEHRIRHRLLGAAADTRLAARQPNGNLPPEWVAALLQGQPRADSWLGLGGGVSSRLSSRPVQVAWPDAEGGEGVRLELGGGQGGLAYSAERVVLSFDTEALSLTDGDAVLHIEQPHYGLLLHPGPERGYGRLPDFDLGLGARRLSLHDGYRELFTAESLQVTSWQNSAADRLDNLLRLRVEAVQSPDLDLDGMEMHLTALRLHRPTVLRLIEDLGGVRASAPEPGARAGLVLGLLLDGLQQMIAHDPRVQGELRLNSDPAKRLRARLDLGLQGDAALLATRPLEALALAVDLEAGTELVDALAALSADPDGLRTWIDLGLKEQWIESGGGQLNSRLRLNDGRLLINDRDQTILLLAAVFALGQGMF
jgi:hypothetical protein